jgi:hypothetical protein
MRKEKVLKAPREMIRMDPPAAQGRDDSRILLEISGSDAIVDAQ